MARKLEQTEAGKLELWAVEVSNAVTRDHRKHPKTGTGSAILQNTGATAASVGMHTYM